MEKCNGGSHSLVIIMTKPAGYDCDKVVRWCEYCGAVVVDLDTDNRTSPGHFRPMQFPKLMKELTAGA